MAGSVFISNNKLPISVGRARQILGTESIDMTDDEVEAMLRRVVTATDVIVGVITDSKKQPAIAEYDPIYDNEA